MGGGKVSSNPFRTRTAVLETRGEATAKLLPMTEMNPKKWFRLVIVHYLDPVRGGVSVTVCS